MKANKKTLMAVKKYLTEPEGYNMNEVITQMVEDTEMLRTTMEKNDKEISLAVDECTIIWGADAVSNEDVICGLEDFVEAFSEKFIEYIGNVLDSFVGDDIDCYLED